MANPREEANSVDAVRLLCNAIRDIHYLDANGDGITMPCEDVGECIIVDALTYLAHGNTSAARVFIDIYDQWKETGYLPWPYCDENNPNLVPPDCYPAMPGGQ